MREVKRLANLTVTGLASLGISTIFTQKPIQLDLKTLVSLVVFVVVARMMYKEDKIK